jgi:hypothetical protein
MDNKDLRTLLQQLHEEVQNTQSVDEKGSELLRDLDKDIRVLLARSEEDQVQMHPSMVERLDSSLHHFEITHPTLTMLISKLMDTLSNAGI